MRRARGSRVSPAGAPGRNRGPKEPPRILWRPVLLGGAVAVLVSLVISLAALAAGSQALLIAATPFGIGAGGAAAGRLARAAGALQGGMVGVLWIIAEALAEALGPPASDVVADVALTLLGDAGRIAIGAFFGWLAARSVREPPGGRRGAQPPA